MSGPAARIMTKFAQWPEWLKIGVLVPHGILGYVATWLWWPKSSSGRRKFGIAAAYLIVFFLVMRYVFDAR